VSARNIRRLGGAQHAKAVPELPSVNESAISMNDAKWGTGPETPMLEGVSEIIDVEDFDDDE